MAWNTSTDCSGARIATGVAPTHGGYTATRRGQEDLKQIPRDSERRGSVFTHAAPQRSAMCSFAARAVGSALWLLIFGPPCAAVRGGRSGPQGNRQGCRFLFAGAGAPSKSPAAPHGLAGFTGQRQVGVPFLWALPPSRWLLFFGQAKKSDPASGRRSEARGRRARSPLRDNHRPRAKVTGPLPSQG